MDIHIRKVTLHNHAQVYYVIFWEGKMSTPIGLLSEFELKRLLAEGQEQLKVALPPKQRRKNVKDEK